MRLELLRDAVAAARLPEVLGERCVHSLIERATCRRCVDACPTGAWVIDEERLGIDPARCDGCGLCAPACPQAAIVARTAEPLRVGIPGRSGFPAAMENRDKNVAPTRPASVSEPGRSGFPAATENRDKNVAPTRPASVSEPGRSGLPAATDRAAVLACERAFPGRSGFPAATDRAPMFACEPAFPGRSGFQAATQDRDTNVAPTSGAGIAPCVHALGLRDLARLAAAGCTRLIVSTGDCDACPRGSVVRLESRLADLARLLDSRGLPILRLERLPPDRWQAVRDAAAPDAGPAMGRRGFLRRGLGLAVDQAASAFALAAAERDSIETVPRLLPDSGRPGALVPAAPRIDPTTCTGCDACVRLCPQQAIQLERAALEYRILPEACTGCGICVDVCADGAVRLEAWVPVVPVALPLAEATCARCRVRFHRPVIAVDEAPPQCPICASRRGTDRLLRVQE